METREIERCLISLSSPLDDGAGCKDKGEIIEEVKRQIWLASPLICESLLLYCLQLISVMFVGHLGAVALSSASLATSFAAVLGFNLLMGMSTALETLCGQSYGAKQYRMLGMHTQRAMVVLSLISLPLAIILAYTGSILAALGQDLEISRAAGVYARYMIPTLFAYAIGSYYIVGIPLSVVLAFVFRIGTKGLWLGITAALTTQMMFLLIITVRSNWEQEVKRPSITFLQTITSSCLCFSAQFTNIIFLIFRRKKLCKESINLKYLCRPTMLYPEAQFLQFYSRKGLGLKLVV